MALSDGRGQNISRELVYRFTKSGLSLVALLGGGWYLGTAIRHSIGQISRLHVSISLASGLTLLICVVATLAISSLYYVETLARVEPVQKNRLRIANGYSLGQIVRYVPGKIVGLIFQANYLSGYVKPSSVTLALIVQTAHDNAWTLVFACSILTYAIGQPALSLALLLAGLSLLHFSHRHAWIERVVLTPGFIRRRIGVEEVGRIRSTHAAGAATLLLALVWIPTFAGLYVFFGDLATPTQVAVLGACYLLASIGSMLVFVVPSGVVVREALFLYLGSSIGIDESLLIYSGVALRLALTGGEVLCAALFSCLLFTVRKRGTPDPDAA